MAITKRGKALPPEKNERLREIVREVLVRDFDNNATALAKKIGVSQPMVAEFLAGSRGAGPKMIEGIADVTGRSIDDLYGRAAPRVEYDAPRGLNASALGMRPGFAAAREACEKRYGRRLVGYPGILDDVAQLSGSKFPQHITAEVVLAFAEALIKAREAIESERAERKA